jgi:hypothetical protein
MQFQGFYDIHPGKLLFFKHLVPNITGDVHATDDRSAIADQREPGCATVLYQRRKMQKILIKTIGYNYPKRKSHAAAWLFIAM